MSKLENTCLNILIYAEKQWPRWVSITELSNELNLSASTIRNVFLVSKTGVFIKHDESTGKTSIHSDAFIKIATKYHFFFQLRKMKNHTGHETWHISVVKSPYNKD